MSLFKQIKRDWIAHGRHWTKPGFLAVACLRFGQWRMTIKPKLIRIPFSMIYKLWFIRCRNVYGIELPYSVKLGQDVVFEHQGNIVIHGDVEIGDGCIIRQGCTLGNKNMNKPYDAPKLGNRVNVGAGAVILGAVVIGDNAQIGANSVVTKNIPDNTTVIGVPARDIKNAVKIEKASHV